MTTRICGHGPNECDVRNPDCIADIIQTQQRRIDCLQISRDGIRWEGDGQPMTVVITVTTTNGNSITVGPNQIGRQAEWDEVIARTCREMNALLGGAL